MDPDHHHHSQEHGSGGYHNVHDQWVTSTTSPFQTHHQSPVHEYGSFNFTPMPIEPLYANVSMPPPQHTRLTSHHQLQPLMVPPWPSQLTQHSAYPTSVYHQTPVTTTPITTPVSAPPTTGRHHSERPRKTLTDADRRRMCKYAEDNPSVKQTEIGAMFGVERSTVSKVLRLRDKYLKKEEVKRDPKPKGKLPDIEKALSTWVKNRQKAGQPITDAHIQDQLKLFSTTVGGDSAASNSSWLEKFKVKNGLFGTKTSKSRKASVADDPDTGKASRQQTPNASPTSPSHKRDPSPSRLSMAMDDGVKDHKRVKSESPGERDASPISAISPQSHKPFASISSAFTDVSTPSSQPHSHSASYSLSPMRPHSPFFPTNPFSPEQHLQAPNSTGSNSFRPRSQTFPISTAPMESYLSPPSSNSDLAVGKLLSGPGPESMESPSAIMLMQSSPVVPSRSTTSNPSSIMGDALSPAYGIPVSAVEGPESVLQQLSRPGPPSVLETQRALQVVWNFFANQHQHQQLDPEDYATIGKLMEKLKLQQSISDIPVSYGLGTSAYALAKSLAE